MAFKPSAEPLNDVRITVVPVIPGKVPEKTALFEAISCERLFPVKSWHTLKVLPRAPTEE